MERPRYQERIVAFVDILGFRDIVKKAGQKTTRLDSIYKVLRLLKNQEKSTKWNMDIVEIEESAQLKGLSKFDISNRMNCTCFSDSIVVSVRIKDNVNEMISTLICNLSTIGALLMDDGILIRGGITIGRIIHGDNGIIMGQGLIDAFELESKTAKNPRIILSDVLLAKMNYPILTKSEEYPYHQYLMRFEDGCVGFHQLKYFEVVQAWTKMTNIKLETALKRVREKIVIGLNRSFVEPEIYQKYDWLRKQYNDLDIIESGLKPTINNLNELNDNNNIHYAFKEMKTTVSKRK